MWPSEEHGKVGTFNKNILQAKGTARYYLSELERLLGKNFKRIKTFQTIWVCRILACIGLYVLFWSIPVGFWLAVLLWTFSGKVEIVNYFFGLKPDFTNTLIEPHQRKTILITGESTTKG